MTERVDYNVNIATNAYIVMDKKWCMVSDDNPEISFVPCGDNCKDDFDLFKTVLLYCNSPIFVYTRYNPCIDFER